MSCLIYGHQAASFYEACVKGSYRAQNFKISGLADECVQGRLQKVVVVAKGSTAILLYIFSIMSLKKLLVCLLRINRLG